MKYLFILFILTGCTIPHYVMLNNQKVDCRKVSKVWWGTKGQQPTAREVEELCACNAWEIKIKE